MEDILTYFKNNICANCKAKCDNGIVIVNTGTETKAKCGNYERKDEKTNVEPPLERTAKQKKSLMGFRQNY